VSHSNCASSNWAHVTDADNARNMLSIAEASGLIAAVVMISRLNLRHCSFPPVFR